MYGAGMVVVTLLLVGCGRAHFDPIAGDPRDSLTDDTLLPAPCTSGTAIPVATILNLSPMVPTDACAIDNAAALDGLVAGLDRANSDTCPTTLDPTGSCGCLAADLGAAYMVDSIAVHAAAVSDACGVTPCTLCGTGDVMSVMFGTDPGQLTIAGHPNLTTTLTTYSFMVRQSVRYVAVCRQSYGQERDDIVVDAVQATCM